MERGWKGARAQRRVRRDNVRDKLAKDRLNRVKTDSRYHPPLTRLRYTPPPHPSGRASLSSFSLFGYRNLRRAVLVFVRSALYHR